MAEENVEEQKFGLFVIRRIDKKTKKIQVQLKTKGEGIPLADAVIIVEGWAKKVNFKNHIQKI